VRVGGGALERGELLGAVRAQPRAVRVLAEVHDVRGPLGCGECAEEGEQDDGGGGERRHGLWTVAVAPGLGRETQCTSARGWVIYTQPRRAACARGLCLPPAGVVDGAETGKTVRSIL
jgi:hypothetical protein